MSDLTFVLIAIGTWLAVGLITAWWMARRGYRDRRWLFMGAFLGPALALAAGERVERKPEQVLHLERSAPRPHGLRVLVGVDGSAEAQAALDLAVGLLGPYTESLVTAEVVGYDAAEADRDPEVVAAEGRLRSVAERGGHRVTACEILSGPPAEALASYAGQQDVDFVVVGSHGRGLSKRLLGSVAQELLREGSVPVLVTGSHRDVSRK